MESWWLPLQEGAVDAAWDLFIDRYRRLILATIRRTVKARDEVPDVFAHVCQALAAEDLRALRRYYDGEMRARFSTWLVIVVRNQTVDWMRKESGRNRHSIPASLSPLQRTIFRLVFAERRSHAEAYELLRAGDEPNLTFAAFLRRLGETYRLVENSGPRGVLRHFASQPELSPEPAAHPATAVSLDEARGRLHALLESLPADTRLAIQLFVVDEIPAHEVAQTIGWHSAKDVYNRVYRALASMRRTLERQGMHRSDL